jgi:hypothetical protein
LPPVGRSVSKFNPNHDELGRFASGPGGGAKGRQSFRGSRHPDARENYTIKQDTDGHYYSFTSHGTVEERVTDEGFKTRREAVYHLGNLIDTGTVPGGRITLPAKVKDTLAADTPLYRGSVDPTLRVSPHGESGPGIYLSTDLAVAEKYASAKRDFRPGAKVTAYTTTRPLRLLDRSTPEGEELFRTLQRRQGKSLSGDEFMARMKAEGYDGVSYPGVSGENETVIYDASLLRQGTVSKFNPHHDELGRFASGPGGGVPAGPKRGQPHTAKRKPSRLGMTGEPNPVTGTIMSNTEFGDTMETLFRQRAGRQSGFKKMFGGRLRALVGHGEQARTGALDYRTDTFGIEVKSLNTRAKDKRVKISRRAVAAKRLEAERLGVRGGIAVQVVDFDRGTVTIYGWDKGFSNPSTKASPTSVNVQFNPVTQGTKLGEYRFTRSQWHKAQKETSRLGARSRLKGSWGDYDAPDTMGKMDDLTWRAELRKVRDETDPLPRPDAVQRLMKNREAPMTDEDERIEAGDTVIQLVEQEGKWVPHIYEAE